MTEAKTTKTIVLLNKEVSMKMRYYIEHASGEISGMARAKMDEDLGVLVVDDIMIVEQECTASHTNMDAEAQAKFMTEIHRRGDNLKDWCVWWHSHAHMAVFFSATDTGTISEHEHMDYMVSIVGNKNGEFDARLDMWTDAISPIGTTRLSYMIPLEVHSFDKAHDAELSEKIKEEVKEKVKAPVYTPTTTPYHYGKGQGSLIPTKAPQKKSDGSGSANVDDEEVSYWCITHNCFDCYVQNCLFNKITLLEEYLEEGMITDSEYEHELGFYPDYLGNVPEGEYTPYKITNVKTRKEWEATVLSEGRRFNEAGYDDDGYTVDGFDSQDVYNEAYDDVNTRTE